MFNRYEPNKYEVQHFKPYYKADLTSTSLDEHWIIKDGIIGVNPIWCYKPTNVEVGGGLLKLTAKKETVTHNSVTYNYTSGWVDFQPLIKYGRFKVTAKVPLVHGCWPAIWMMCPWVADWTNTQGYGEFDMLESYGIAIEGEPGFTIWHGPDEAGMVNKTYMQTVPNFENNFHDYQMDWLPDSVVMYMDGHVVMVFDPRTAIVSGKDPLRQPMQFILNLAFGSSAGAVVDSEFPFAMEISNIEILTV